MKPIFIQITTNIGAYILQITFFQIAPDIPPSLHLIKNSLIV